MVSLSWRRSTSSSPNSRPNLCCRSASNKRNFSNKCKFSNKRRFNNRRRFSTRASRWWLAGQAEPNLLSRRASSRRPLPEWQTLYSPPPPTSSNRSSSFHRSGRPCRTRLRRPPPALGCCCARRRRSTNSPRRSRCRRRGRSTCHKNLRRLTQQHSPLYRPPRRTSRPRQLLRPTFQLHYCSTRPCRLPVFPNLFKTTSWCR